MRGLHDAAARNDVGELERLVEAGNDVNEVDHTFSGYNVTPLHVAARDGKLDAVKFLVSKGANVEAHESFFYRTPLHWACANGHMEVVAFLRESGARTWTDIGDAALYLPADTQGMKPSVEPNVAATHQAPLLLMNQIRAEFASLQIARDAFQKEQEKARAMFWEATQALADAREKFAHEQEEAVKCLREEVQRLRSELVGGSK